MSMIPTNKVLKDNTRVKEEAPIRDGWSGRHRGTCLVGEWVLAAPLISDLCVRGGRPPGFQDDASRFRVRIADLHERHDQDGHAAGRRCQGHDVSSGEVREGV